MRPVLWCALGLFACGSNPIKPPPDAGDEMPPAICRTPATNNGAWLTEITSDVALAKTDSLEPLGVGIVAADVDQDGWVDFWSASTSIEGPKQTRFLFMNRPDPNDPAKRVFVDAIADSGLLARRDGTSPRQISSIAFGDLNNDGNIDAVGCAGDIDARLKDSCAAFLGDGKGHFQLAPDGGDLEKDVFTAGSIALLDFDRDGILDMWPATIGHWQYCPGQSFPSCPAPESEIRFYKGVGDGTFTRVANIDAKLPTTKTAYMDFRQIFGVTSCDVDLDGNRDVILAEYGQPVGQNHVFMNNGDGTFTDRGRELGVWKGIGATPEKGGGFTFAIACGDLENDGDIDLFTAELRHEWVSDGDFSEALVNRTQSGQSLAPFVRPGREAMGFTRPHAGTLWTEGDSLVQMVDIDLDGRKDVYINSVNYPQQNASDPDWTHDWLYRQNADGTFADVTKTNTPFFDKNLQSLGNSALIDIDNDGDLDIVTGTATYNAEFLGLTNAIHAFRNDAPNGANMVRVRIKGGNGSNASGIGARVEIKTNGATQQQEVLGAWASTQSDVTLTFGVGSACKIDEMIVHWPDAAGTVTHYKDVLPNYLVEIIAGDAKPHYKLLNGSAWKK